MYPTTAPVETRPDDAAGRGAHQIHGPPPADIKSTLNAATQVTQQSPSLSTRLSESPELTRTMISPAHQVKKVGNLPGVSRSAKTAAT
jgi:hypothetical protein